jgi:hypothetical protein
MSTGFGPRIGNKSKIFPRTSLIRSEINTSRFFVFSGALHSTRSLATTCDSEIENVSDKCHEAHSLKISSKRQFVTVIRHERLNRVLGDIRYFRDDKIDLGANRYR